MPFFAFRSLRSAKTPGNGYSRHPVGLKQQYSRAWSFAKRNSEKPKGCAFWFDILLAQTGQQVVFPAAPGAFPAFLMGVAALLPAFGFIPAGCKTDADDDPPPPPHISRF
jgi:hypothetical protein